MAAFLLRTTDYGLRTMDYGLRTLPVCRRPVFGYHWSKQRGGFATEAGRRMNEETFSQRRVLITGGLGFIGSTLARRLVEMRARVTVADSLVPEYGGNLFNIVGLEDKLQVNISDVRDEHSMRYLVQGQDFLFNLAGQT